MKIVTWNVNGLRAAASKGLVGFMQRENADAYCFQEVKSENTLLVEGYHAYSFPARKKGYSGVSIYSKEPVLSLVKGIGHAPADEEGRVLTAEFEDFFLVNAYFPHSQRELARLDFKLRFNELFQKYCGALSKKKPVVIAADFNVAHQEIDLRNARENEKNAGFTAQERAWFGSLLQSGFIDAFREFEKNGGHYTWWTYRNNARQRNIGWRIDTFVVSEKLRPKLANCAILKDVQGSDHCPVCLELR